MKEKILKQYIKKLENITKILKYCLLMIIHQIGQSMK